MLCHEVKVDESIWKEFGMDGAAVTAAYRKTIVEQLKKLKVRGFGSERKWDGTRVLGINEEDGAITLQNRHGIIYTIRLPEIVKALKRLPEACIIDGEVVYIDPGTGEELFSPCQRRCATQMPDWMLREKYPVKLEAFDLLQLNGECLERRPYFERKDLLHKLLAVNNEDPALEYVCYDSDLLNAWTEAIDKDREGLIVKRLDSPYEHDRSYSWLKVKNWRFIDCDIVGFTSGANARSSFFGSLVLAREGKYIGKAGSGFNEWELRKMKDTLFDAVTDKKPLQIGEPYQAVDVKMQALVKYYQTTDAGVMRFPVYITST
jgi:ATP-dependent DNA ligase